jgi:hypothetical protein
MGGGHYSQDMAIQSRAGGGHSWSKRRPVDAQLNPAAGPREVNNNTPIVVALDVTRSRGDDTRKLYDKLPEMMRKMEARAVVDGPGISFAAIGDADADLAPLQVGQFEADNRLDDVLKLISIEEGGGGTGQESYELAAWYYSRTNCVQLQGGTGKRGFFFFVGDEGFYPMVSAAHVKKLCGVELPSDIRSADAFAALQEKFHTFLIYPGTTAEERQSDIDAEIRTRVLAAGGQYADVDVRVSLIWNRRDDLDLYVVCPSGETISFNHKRSECGGALDVDRNVRGETTEPIENIRWPEGSAPAGTYTVRVNNYAYHERDKGPVPFRVEIENDGDIQHFDMETPTGKNRSTRTTAVCSFDFDPDPEAQAERYAAYSDEVVLGMWTSVIPDNHILKVRDPDAIFDVILGALAIANGRDDLAGYIAKLAQEGAAEAHLGEIRSALQGVTTLD